MNIGARLKSERERLGLSQPAFAEIAGARKHALINWEKGKAFPNAAALVAWAAAGVDVQYVLTGQALPPEQLALYQRAAALTLETATPVQALNASVVTLAAEAAAHQTRPLQWPRPQTSPAPRTAPDAAEGSQGLPVDHLSAIERRLQKLEAWLPVLDHFFGPLP